MSTELINPVQLILKCYGLNKFSFVIVIKWKYCVPQEKTIENGDL